MYTRTMFWSRQERWNDFVGLSGFCDLTFILTKREVLLAMESGNQYLCDTSDRFKDMARALLKVVI
jgi:hypothetical protein